MIYSFYVYTRNGTCLYYEEWNRRNPTKNQLEDQKLLFGLVYQLKSFVAKTSPKPIDTFNYYKTNTYKLHLFETATGLKFILMTDIACPSMKDELSKIYKDIYVEYVGKNPTYKIGDPITCDIFILKTSEHLKKLPFFASPAPPTVP